MARADRYNLSTGIRSRYLNHERAQRAQRRRLRRVEARTFLMLQEAGEMWPPPPPRRSDELMGWPPRDDDGTADVN